MLEALLPRSSAETGSYGLLGVLGSRFLSGHHDLDLHFLVAS